MRKIAFVILTVLSSPAFAQSAADSDLATLGDDYQAELTARRHFTQSVQKVIDDYQSLKAKKAADDAYWKAWFAPSESTVK